MMKQFARRARSKMLQITALTAALTTAFGTLNVALPIKADAAGSYLLNLNRPAYASSSQGNNSPDLAMDGDLGSRWESAWGVDNQWIYVDLGANASITGVTLRWEGAYSTNYKIQTSNDELNWTDAYSTTSGDGGVDNITLSTTGRFVRLLSNAHNFPNYGISLYEFEVYGTGGVNPPPVQLGTNVALNKAVTASSYQVADYLPAGATLPSNAVDGNATTRWGSNLTDNEWITVDLGSVHTLGRVILNWEAAAGRIYDIQLSNDNNNWTTVYREMHGDGGVLNLPIYASGRYLRMKGISRATSFGYSLFEIQAYDYVAGDPKPSYTITPLPTATAVNVGQGGYVKDDMTIPQPKYPGYKADNLTAPLPSNDWWQSVMINKLGNGIITLPLKSKYTKQGLGVLNPGAGYVSADGGTQAADGSPDLFLTSNNLNPSTLVNKITGYGDWSADVSLTDGSAEMKTTFVKGSPYLFSQFSSPGSAELYLPATTRIFDDSNATLLATDGASITADHIGIQVTNSNGAPTPSMVTRYYGIFAPAGTVFQKVGSKIKIQLGSGQNYLSLASIPAATNLNYYYQHAYAFITGTTVSYNFNEATSDVTTNFNVTTTLKRTGFPNTTLLAQLPHQWKITTTPVTALSYPSIRGQLKVTEGNSFTTANKFYGIVPQFTEPGDSSYSRQALVQYLAKLDTDTATNLMISDPYWQGKKLHPLAMGVLIADQIGDANYKSLFLGRMKTVLSDWYTYTAGEPSYYFDYNTDWGTLIYKDSGFGANSGITDHHFTYGYYVFASAVLAAYDQDFKDKYGAMVEHLIRDYANPSKTDPLFPFFRNFDPYEGHSWAGGYADNDSGNNQEAAGESLFGWVGEYLWGVTSGNTAYRNAAIYGFTTELKAVEQYWFNYDQDNWLPGYNHKSVGQVYGSSNFFGTFFDGRPVYVYGIHWLPTSEYLTSYGFDSAKVNTLYNGLVADIGGPENDWYHIVWPIQSLFDSQAVLNKFNPSIVQQNELFNTYWFVHSMATLGQRTKDIYAVGGASATVYKKGTAYAALIWNPTSTSQTVTFKNAQGTVTGSATVAAKTLVKVNPQANSNQGGSPPVLTADSTLNKVGQPIEITFADNAAWRSAITAVKVNGTTAAAGQYSVTAGKITLNAALFPQPQTYNVTVEANGFVPAGVAQPIQSASTGTPNLALNKTATSTGTPNSAASLAVDGNPATRWESQFADPQAITIDLGATYAVDHVVLNWEAAYGKSYTIQTSVDGTNWSTAYSTTTGDGAIDDINFAPANARYVKMNGTVRGTQYGYSLYEFEVYGTGGNQSTLTPPALTADSTQNNVGQPMDITFADNAAWRGAISSVKVDGTAAAANQYTVAAGKITLNAGLFPTAKAYAITVQAAGYTDASVQQTVGAAASGTNLALNKPVTATGAPLQAAALAVDGNPGTRWESQFADPQAITVDLGATYAVDHVVLNWEGAYGKAYTIQTSTDGANWSTVYSTTTGSGGVNDLTFAATNARYVKMNGTVRGTQYGYSLWEFEVYGGAALPPQNPVNLALNRAAASSANPLQPASLAFDGNTGSRWESQFSDPQWVSVDLGAVQSISRVVLNWEGAYAKSYKIEVSTDGAAWNQVYATTAGDGGVDELTFAQTGARYVRMTGTERGTPYGYSLWEMSVYP